MSVAAAASLVELLQPRDVSWQRTRFTQTLFKYPPDLQDALFSFRHAS